MAGCGLTYIVATANRGHPADPDNEILGEKYMKMTKDYMFTTYRL